jgi:hypothetical protein
VAGPLGFVGVQIERINGSPWGFGKSHDPNRGRSSPRSKSKAAAISRNFLPPPEFEAMNRETDIFESEGIMRKFCAVLIAVGCSLAFAALAQDTNALKTEIGIFESQTGVVIVKGFSQVGSVSTGAAVISVRCKESSSAATSHKDYGIAVIIEVNQWRGLAIVDYDELDSLLNGMDYIGKVTYNVTALPGFEATFTTKSSLQFVAFGNKQQGGIRTYLQYDDSPRISLTSDQWTQLVNLIGQAKTTLDSLRTPK